MWTFMLRRTEREERRVRPNDSTIHLIKTKLDNTQAGNNVVVREEDGEKDGGMMIPRKYPVMISTKGV